jgi:TonB family protein
LQFVRFGSRMTRWKMTVKAFYLAALFAASYAVGSAQVAPLHSCKPNEDGACATPPKIIRHVDPEYSEHGRKKKINGTVVVTFTVLPDGTTADIVVTRSLEKSLDKQAIKAVRQWRFEPGTYQHQPVAVSISAEAAFHIY